MSGEPALVPDELVIATSLSISIRAAVMACYKLASSSLLAAVAAACAASALGSTAIVC